MHFAQAHVLGLRELSRAASLAQVNIYLEKEREAWWKSALHGDAEIDTTQVLNEFSQAA